MDNNKIFSDELEPRITPQPTIFKYITDSVVPEVSLIFGKPPHVTQLPTKNSHASGETYKAYEKWKKDGYPSLSDSKIVLKNAVPNDPPNVPAGTRRVECRSKFMLNNLPIQYQANQGAGVPKSCTLTAAGDFVDTMHLRNSEYAVRDEIYVSALPGGKSFEVPGQNNSHEAVKSILKSFPLKSPPKSDNSLQPGSNFQSHNQPQLDQRKQQHQQHSSTDYDDSLYARRVPPRRSKHSREVNQEQDAVRDLLLLVKNQNEQIKSLQSQVERLFQIQEHNKGNLENRSCALPKTSGQSLMSVCTRETNTASTSKHATAGSARNTCHCREIHMVPSESLDKDPEICSRYGPDPLRNAIVEKKVSIGVMTSFEFSVHNNPFVSDSDLQTNAGLCNSAVKPNEPRETWRPIARTSKKMVTGPLENISEDTESHLSSIAKHSCDDTRESSSQRVASNLATSMNDVDPDGPEDSPIPKMSRTRPRGDEASVASPQKQTPLAAHGSFGAREDRRVSNERTRTPENPGGSPIDAAFAQDYNGSYHQDGPIVNDRRTGLEVTRGPCSKNMERTGSRYSEEPENGMRSMPAENTAEDSFVLHSSDLEVLDRVSPSLEPSIHVEMREYSSDDENEISQRAPAVGWTFYQNVVGEVDKILHPVTGPQDLNRDRKMKPRRFNNEIFGNEDVLTSVKAATTLDRQKMLGLSCADNSGLAGEHTLKKVTFDSSYSTPVDYQANALQPTSSITDTNTSLHMKALALKYLTDEQLADFAIHKQERGTTMKHKFLSVHGSNMSLATVNYLQRHCLVSEMHTPNIDGNAPCSGKPKHWVITEELLTRSTTSNCTVQESIEKGGSDNILDITTLKRQPKLL